MVRSLESLSQLRRGEALAGGLGVTPSTVAAQRGVSVRVVLAAIRAGELASFTPVDSCRALVPPEAAAVWRAPTLATIEESLSVRQAAVRTGVSRDVIWKAIRQGKLAASRPGGASDYRITAVALNAWMAGNVALDTAGAARRIMGGHARANPGRA